MLWGFIGIGLFLYGAASLATREANRPMIFQSPVGYLMNLIVIAVSLALIVNGFF